MNQKVLRHDTHCRVCGSRSIETVIRLKGTPLEDQFVREEYKDVIQSVYPLEVAVCGDCGYVHLPYVVNPEASYADYVYVSGVTVGLRNHYDNYAKEIVSDFDIPKQSLAVDLGSNDGSMLASFKRTGMKILGVEPAQAIARQANEAGLPTLNRFFTDDVTAEILKDFGPACVVTANYMYANVDNVMGFARSVAKLLAPDGIFVVQTGYHPEQMKIKMFDYIYHEHFSYFTVEVLRRIFSSCGLELIRAEKISPKGGSIRAVGQLQNGSRPVDASVNQLILEERAHGMHDAETYRKFALEIEDSKKKLRDLLGGIKALGKRIVGFGASHSTTTLLHHFELASFLEYLADDNPLKHGRYSPGYHLPVYPSAKLYEDLPDYVVILAWQHQRSIIEKHREYLPQARWILPLPEAQMV